MKSKIILKYLSVFYQNRPIINNLNLEIPLNDFIVVAGNNGSGKTSLLKAILGKIPYTGSIFLGNEDTKITENINPHYVSYLEQNTPYQIPFTVLELVVMGAYPKKSRFSPYSEDDYVKAEECLRYLSAVKLKDRIFSELSGGEQILVWLAQVLLMDSELILLDEPTRHLDNYHTKLVLELLYQWVEEKKKSIMLITHDLNALKGYKGKLINLSENPTALEELNEGNILRTLERLKEGIK